jgi:hypothetical protein
MKKKTLHYITQALNIEVSKGILACGIPHIFSGMILLSTFFIYRMKLKQNKVLVSIVGAEGPLDRGREAANVSMAPIAIFSLLCQLLMF